MNILHPGEPRELQNLGTVIDPKEIADRDKQKIKIKLNKFLHSPSSLEIPVSWLLPGREQGKQKMDPVSGATLTQKMYATEW